MDLPDIATRATRASRANPGHADDAHACVAQHVADGNAVVLATAVKVEGQPPCQIGQKVVASAQGVVFGTLGCAEFDERATADAAAALADATPRTVRYEHEQGAVEVYLEPFHPRPRLVVFGANGVATHLLEWATDLGYDTTLVESRTDRITDRQRAIATEVVNSIDEAHLPAVFDAVHADHDAPDLGRELAIALRKNVRTISLIASRRHAAQFVDTVRDFGATDADVARINTPAGLDLGGRSAPEIALSVLAGLVAARYGRSGGFLASPG